MLRRIRLIVLLSLATLSFSNAQISPEKLIKRYSKMLKNHQVFDIGSEDFRLTITGEMAMGELSGIPAIVFFADGNMRLQIELMGSSFIQVSSDSITWSRDPFTRTYDFEKFEGVGGFFGMDLNSDNFIQELLDEGWMTERVSEVELDSISAYSLLLTKTDSLDNVFSIDAFFDKEKYYFLGYKQDEEAEYYLNYRVVNNFLLPHGFATKGGADGDIYFSIKSYDFESEVSLSIFEMTEEAKTAYLEYIKPKEKPVNRVQVLYDEGLALGKEGQYQEEISKYNEALKINDKDIVVHNARGLAYINTQDYYSAIADFKRAIDLADEPISEHYNNLGLAKYYLGDNKGAKDDYDLAIKLDSTKPTIHDNIGLLYIRLEDYKNAELSYDKAMKLDSTNALRIYYRGFVRAQQGKYAEADSDYQKTKEMGTEGAAFSNYWGVAKYQLSDYDEALRLFQEAYKLDSSNVQYIVNVAGTYKYIENGYPRVVDIYSKLIDKDSTNSEYYAERAVANYELALYKAARTDIDSAIKLYGENALYYDYRAYIKEFSGDYTGAIEDFTTSLDLEQDSNIYYRRGLAKLNISNKFDACKDFKKSSEMEDENGKAALAEHCKL